jgi:predicted nucleic acid-binding Zn ribbon protein
MKAIGSLLGNNFLNKKKLESKIDQETIFFIFREVIKKEFGDIGGAYFDPSYLSKKTIFIKSKSPAWASELWLNQERILDKVNKKIGKKVLEKMTIK